MVLIQTIDNDFVSSLRKRQQEKVDTLRMLKSSLKNFSIAKRVPLTELTDDQVLAIIRQEVKKRKESIEAFKGGGRQELADKEAKELTILETYLPASMSADEIKAIIAAVVAEQKLTPPYQFGSLMGAVVKKVAGRADGTVVRTEVQSFIAEKG